MQQNSDQWLSFLQVHPDPIVITSDERGMFFANKDCQRILAPDLVGAGLTEQEALVCLQE